MLTAALAARITRLWPDAHMIVIDEYETAVGGTDYGPLSVHDAAGNPIWVSPYHQANDLDEAGDDLDEETFDHICCGLRAAASLPGLLVPHEGHQNLIRGYMVGALYELRLDNACHAAGVVPGDDTPFTAQHTLTLMLASPGPLAESDARAPLARGVTGTLSTIHIGRHSGALTIIRAELTTFADPAYACRHLAKQLSNLPGVVETAVLARPDGGVINVYCPRRDDGCDQLADHSGKCFSDENARSYTLMLTAEATDEQIADLLEPFIQNYCGGTFLGTLRHPDNSIGANFRGHEDPHQVRDVLAERLAQQPIRVSVAYLVYDVPGMAADVHLDIPCGYGS